METSRFQLWLIATLTIGLGFSLASSEAIGYPAGPAVSLGTNPVWSVGGFTEAAETIEIGTAPVGMDMIITDVHMTGSCRNCTIRASIETESSTLASYRWWQWSDGGGETSSVISPDPIAQSMVSGLRVPAGESVTLTISGHGMDYTISGYYAQP
jgi:hypothetical protein